eukprot:3053821-Amphidinium_carterae.1
MLAGPMPLWKCQDILNVHTIVPTSSGIRNSGAVTPASPPELGAVDPASVLALGTLRWIPL